ncbi:sulfatase-like hydrolase/transferase [Halomicrococcus sp. NG-SE-24]|uniref:sulfatase-like hydrolase/transferase n=1 Tax=Halomicrococcus sp. NG-SE-24 TaxID=3436928 RepID=UPI003D98EF2C
MSNIALVVLDTLRKDYFDKHFDWLPGQRFEHAYSTANWTIPAHASLFTGKYASEVGVHSKNMYLDCDEPVLAEQLQRAGYTTRAFSANTNASGHFDFDRGFTEFGAPDKMEHLNDDRIFEWRKFNRETDKEGVEKYLNALYECYRDDTATIPSLVKGFQLIREGGNPTEYGGAAEALEHVQETDFGDQEFLFINVMEAHEPYRVPPEYASVSEPDLTDSVGDISVSGMDPEQTKQAYDDCARYLSDIYKKIFGRLQEDFDYVITLSDHGESLGEHDAWGHEYGVYPELIHVPLTISGDGLSGVSEASVSILDVHATIQDIAGLEGDSRGRSLLEEVDDEEFLAEYQGLTSWSEEKLAENGYEDQIPAYDQKLHGYVAPVDFYGYETQNGFRTTGTEEVSDAEERMQTLIDQLKTREVSQDNDVPDEIKDRLEDLGYA